MPKKPNRHNKAKEKKKGQNPLLNPQEYPGYIQKIGTAAVLLGWHTDHEIENLNGTHVNRESETYT